MEHLSYGGIKLAAVDGTTFKKLLVAILVLGLSGEGPLKRFHAEQSSEGWSCSFHKRQPVWFGLDRVLFQKSSRNFFWFVLAAIGSVW